MVLSMLTGCSSEYDKYLKIVFGSSTSAAMTLEQYTTSILNNNVNAIAAYLNRKAVTADGDTTTASGGDGSMYYVSDELSKDGAGVVKAGPWQSPMYFVGINVTEGGNMVEFSSEGLEAMAKNEDGYTLPTSVSTCMDTLRTYVKEESTLKNTYKIISNYAAQVDAVPDKPGYYYLRIAYHVN